VRRAYLQSAGRFIWHHASSRWLEFWALSLAVLAAAALSIAMQYQLKRMVDALSSLGGSNHAVWRPLALFAALMAAENALMGSMWANCPARLSVERRQ
jgi:ATP-binding cassette subfamily B protein